MKEDRRAEMTVVRNEFELGENNPMDALGKEIWTAAFIAHPYHHDTIGWRSDIEKVPIEKLRAFYDTFYWPDNATATVIGGFDVAETLQVSSNATARSRSRRIRSRSSTRKSRRRAGSGG